MLVTLIFKRTAFKQKEDILQRSKAVTFILPRLENGMIHSKGDLTNFGIFAHFYKDHTVVRSSEHLPTAETCSRCPQGVRTGGSWQFLSHLPPLDRQAFHSFVRVCVIPARLGRVDEQTAYVPYPTTNKTWIYASSCGGRAAVDNLTVQFWAAGFPALFVQFASYSFAACSSLVISLVSWLCGYRDCPISIIQSLKLLGSHPRIPRSAFLPICRSSALGICVTQGGQGAKTSLGLALHCIN